MRYLIIKKVGSIFTFNESSNGTLEDGIFYSGNTVVLGGFNNEVHVTFWQELKYYSLANVKYKNVVYTTFALLFNELITDGFTGNFKKAGATATIPVQLKDFYTDANNGGLVETDLYTYTTLANRLNIAGEKIVAIYGGTFNDATASSQLKIYFGGVLIGDTGALTSAASLDWLSNVSILRTGATTARSVLNIFTRGASTNAYTKYTSLTGLNFANTNILKITGTAGGTTGGNNDITATYGNIIWQPAAP